MSNSMQSEPGTVRIRSNVTFNRRDIHLIPGDLIKTYRGGQALTPRQHQEKMYYVPCTLCQRSIFEIERDGCEPCATKQPNIAPAAVTARRRQIESLVAPETWLATDLEATQVVPEEKAVR